MKLIIDISDEEYKTLSKMSEKEKVNELSYYERIIANGIPLPKGHGDLIDRDKFKPLMDEYFIDTSRLHYDDLTNAEHLNMGIESCLNEIDERRRRMTNTEKYEEIFNHLLDAMQIAKDLNNDEIFEVLNETGSKIADILDKQGNEE